MRSVIYPMGVSLDEYIVGRDDVSGWAEPDHVLLRFLTDQERCRVARYWSSSGWG